MSLAIITDEKKEKKEKDDDIEIYIFRYWKVI
jgi:hypothetical protein